jgi:hypothetical protein
MSAYLLARGAPLAEGGRVAVRWWGAIAVYALTGAACVVRAVAVERCRAAWALAGGGILAYGTGALVVALSTRDPVQAPVAAHALWGTFYVALYAAVIVLLRTHLRPFTLSFCLDGVVGGLAVGAVCASIVPADLSNVPEGLEVAGFAYPSAELVLLMLVLWAAASTGWRGVRPRRRGRCARTR